MTLFRDNRKCGLLALIVLCSLTVPTAAQTTGTPADQEALRKLKADIVDAINTKNYALAEASVTKPFMATVITQESFTEFSKLKNYFDSLYTRPVLALKDISIEAKADDYSTVMQGTFALNKGTTRERYVLADGRSFDMQGRWTALSLKQDGQWKLMAVHSGTNFLDNPVINAIERNVMWFALAGAAGGAIGGLILGYLLGRRGAARRAGQGSPESSR